MSDLVQLLYASSETQEMNTSDLVDVLKKSRQNNSRLNVTGMLLYRGGNFLQVLEGERTVVENLFNRIRQDPRHHQVSQLFTRAVTKREFAEWEMGFSNLDTFDPTSIPGYSPYLNQSFTSERFKDKTFAFTFLRLFKENLR